VPRADSEGTTGEKKKPKKKGREKRPDRLGGHTRPPKEDRPVEGNRCPKGRTRRRATEKKKEVPRRGKETSCQTKDRYGWKVGTRSILWRQKTQTVRRSIKVKGREKEGVKERK